jgi:transcriptional regulator with XRE-family HTH domain
MTLGQRIRELRQQKNLSLRELGSQLKDAATGTPVSSAFLCDLEKGRRFPSKKMIKKLSIALGTTTEDLEEHDQRSACRKLKELIEINAQYAFAFRKAIQVIRETGMTPEEFVQRVENQTKLPIKASAPLANMPANHAGHGK